MAGAGLRYELLKRINESKEGRSISDLAKGKTPKGEMAATTGTKHKSTISKAINAFKEEGLVQEGRIGKRGRTPWIITDKGKKVLEVVDEVNKSQPTRGELKTKFGESIVESAEKAGLITTEKEPPEDKRKTVLKIIKADQPLVSSDDIHIITDDTIMELGE